ncbi:antibiotic biosynthesis monooxygenase family protein, partial [Duodenibacillus massiliensis]|uniref:antibiotic biosynthesis monooxygenase family protein n=1 Tax=Duodenibacillus massiliensis TaxID=1852381 RepID=UPI003C6CFB52
MSVVVLFEAEFVPGGRERYLALAQKLAERARAADGFISAERFSSLTEFPAFLPGLKPRASCGK